MNCPFQSWQIISSTIFTPGTQFSGWRIKTVAKRQVAPSMNDWWVNIKRIMGENSWKNEEKYDFVNIVHMLSCDVVIVMIGKLPDWLPYYYKTTRHILSWLKLNFRKHCKSCVPLTRCAKRKEFFDKFNCNLSALCWISYSFYSYTHLLN